jgi:hypothetical protein
MPYKTSMECSMKKIKAKDLAQQLDVSISYLNTIWTSIVRDEGECIKEGRTVECTFVGKKHEKEIRKKIKENIVGVCVRR